MDGARRMVVVVLALGSLVLLTAWAADPAGTGGPRERAEAGTTAGAGVVTADDPTRPRAGLAAAAHDPGESGETVPAGLGPVVLARLPPATRQLLVVTGGRADSFRSTAVLWTRDGAGRWHSGARWPAHNGRNGWTERHREGDLRTPEGVFTLSDAGGRLRDPRPSGGLPYHRSAAFTIAGTGFSGEPLDGSFDYVVAIDYNRVRGTTPLNAVRPWGGVHGGGIWLHVDHGGPTRACVSLAKPHMADLIRALEPAARPVVVMGTADYLAR